MTMNFTIDQWNHFLKNNDKEMYSMHNEGGSVVLETLLKFIKYDINIKKYLYL